MATVKTGMEKAEMKKMLMRAKDEPVNCAVGMGENPAFGLLMMHRIRSGKAMEKLLKDEFPDVKNPRFGVAFVDTDDNPKLVKIKLNRAVSGMARRLIKTLKGTGYNKVIIMTEDGSLVEAHEEEDEELEVGDVEGPVATEEVHPAPPGPPPAPPMAAPAAGKSPEQAAAQTAALQKLLATLATMIPKAAGDDATRKATLMKLATDANVNIKTGNLVYAANFLEQLKRALGDAPATAAPAAPAALPVLMASRQEWAGTQEKVKAEVEKLSAELAKTYQGELYAGDINAKFRAKVAPMIAQFDDQLLDTLDDLMNTKDTAEREKLLAHGRGLIKGYLSFAMSDPFIAELDSNPFVKLSIKPIVTGTLANLAKSLH